VRFSIVIPTYNRPAHLRRCLEAITRLRYPRSEFEVVVVDDGSEPPAAEVFAPFEGNLTLRSMRLRQGGPARARNAALAVALGEYVVFTDDDCQPDPGWLEAFDAVFVARPDAGAGGHIVDAPENNIFGRSSQLLVRYLYKYGESSTALPRFFCGNNLAFPRLGLAAFQGFSEGYPLAAGEDRDLCYRWSQQRDLLFAPSAIIAHHQDLNFTGFLRQHVRYGRGAFHFWEQRKMRGELRRSVAPLDFYTGMLLFPLRQLRAPESVGVAVLIALSLAANAAGYFAEKRRKIAAVHPR
jgi:glycosyltransferase involved in cell wall biosynthesis